MDAIYLAVIAVLLGCITVLAYLLRLSMNDAENSRKVAHASVSLRCKRDKEWSDVVALLKAELASRDERESGEEWKYAR